LGLACSIVDYNIAMSWDLIGHEWAADVLAQQLAGGRMRHAYLITGPQGVGRRSLALRLAQAINCPQPTAPGQPCQTCRTCQQIERMQHPDLAVVQAETVGGTLKVDQVRELQHSLSLAPYEARYRIALLLRFEEAHLSAANALLKTLEEPPGRVILMLTAESAENLLPTIVSRCETIRLRAAGLDEAAAGLQKLGVEPEQARLLAHLSGGRPGAALRLHAEPERLTRRAALLDAHMRLLAAPRRERFAYVESLTRSRDERQRDSVREPIQVWLTFWRDVLLRAAGASAPIINLDRQTQVEWAAGRFGYVRAGQTVAALTRALERLERNVNPRLTGDVLMLDLPNGSIG
jgi:DNA polymerase-3 subunit delta'